MTNPAFKGIYISNPCQENWDSMKKSPGGRFCQNCKELVHDFTNGNEMNMADLVKGGKGTFCGRFYEDQLDLTTKNIQVPFSIFSKSLNHIYSIWAFIVFNLVTLNETQAFNFKVKQVQGVLYLKEQNPIEGDSLHFSGRVIDQKDQIVSGAIIELKDKSGKVISTCQSDQNGEFILKSNSPLPKNDFILTVQKKHKEKGYSVNSEKTISFGKRNCSFLVIKINLNKGKRKKLIRRVLVGRVRYKN